jgi:hypothetical protein
VFEISLGKLVSQMSASEIIAELPKLSRTERRQLAVAIFKLEENADLLRDCDRRADERNGGLETWWRGVDVRPRKWQHGLEMVG